MQRIKIDKIESQVAPAEEAGVVLFLPTLRYRYSVTVLFGRDNLPEVKSLSLQGQDIE